MHASLLETCRSSFAFVALTMAQFATVDCLHIVWLKERDIQARLEEGGRLVRGVDGATFVKSSEDDCIENSAFLKPYMVRQRGARSLDVPDLDALKHQLLAMHTSFALNRAKTSKRPRALLEATVELVQVNAHLDAKALKRLFSYARQRYLKPHTPKDARLHSLCEMRQHRYVNERVREFLSE